MTNLEKRVEKLEKELNINNEDRLVIILRINKGDLKPYQCKGYHEQYEEQKQKGKNHIVVRCGYNCDKQDCELYKERNNNS